MNKMKQKYRISRSQLSKLISEAVQKAILKEESQGDTGVGKFASKMDSLIKDQIKSVEELIKEGEEIVKENPTHDYAIQERNNAVMSRIGILKSLQGRLVQIFEDIHKKV